MVVIVVIIWHTKLHLNPKYRSMLNLLTALTIMFTSFAIIIQIYTFNATQHDTEIQLYEQLFSSLILDTMKYFESNPDMNYYYDQMFNPLKIKEKKNIKRNYSKEQQVTRIMIQNLSSIVVFLENDKLLNSNIKNSVQTKFDMFIKGIIASPIFLENYKNMKSGLYSVNLKAYLYENFNM
jgi:hypothetical protein